MSSHLTLTQTSPCFKLEPTIDREAGIGKSECSAFPSVPTTSSLTDDTKAVMRGRKGKGREVLLGQNPANTAGFPLALASHQSSWVPSDPLGNAPI